METDRRFDALSLGSFVMLGLPDGMLGTAWPAIRHSLGPPVGDLGLILLVNTAGSVALAAFVGRLIRRFEVAALLAAACSGAALGGLSYALAPGLWLVLSVGGLIGAAGGLIDGGLNTAVGLSGRPRLLNLLHGFYGVGTTLGPLVVTAAVAAGSWRPAYLVLVGLDLLAAGLWFAYRRRPSGPRNDRSPDPRPEQVRAPSTAPALPLHPDPTRGWTKRKLAAVLTLGMVVFSTYTGLEVAAGQWETSFTRGALHRSASAAGLATFGYWGALTAVRIVLAVPSKLVEPITIIRLGTLTGVVAAAAIWWRPDSAVTVAGFVVLGGALAGVFPALVAVTPLRLGVRRSRDVIAWQVGAAAGGGSAISALIGLLISATSLDILGPALTTLGVVVLVANAALTRLAPGRTAETA